MPLSTSLGPPRQFSDGDKPRAFRFAITRLRNRDREKKCSKNRSDFADSPSIHGGICTQNSPPPPCQQWGNPAKNLLLAWSSTAGLRDPALGPGLRWREKRRMVILVGMRLEIRGKNKEMLLAAVAGQLVISCLFDCCFVLFLFLFLFSFFRAGKGFTRFNPMTWRMITLMESVSYEANLCTASGKTKLLPKHPSLKKEW